MLHTQRTGRFIAAISYISIALLLAPTAGLAAPTLQQLQEQQRKAAEDAEKYRKLQNEQHSAAEKYKVQIQGTEKNINFVEASLATTAAKIDEKETNISTTSHDIDGKVAEFNELRGQQNEAIVALYQLGTPSPAEMLLGSQTLSGVVDQTAFIESIKNNLENLANEVNNAKQDLERKKSELENQRNELSSLKNQQQAQKNGLESEKKQKDYLLSQATTLEKTYNKLADEAEAKKQEFDRQVAAALRARQANGSKGLIIKGPVRQDQVIGYMGNTGYSTGPHLHFSVFRDGSAVNPRGVIGRDVVWPFNSFYVSQEFGRPNWAAKYAFHNGMDMISNAGYGAPVVAACSGRTIEPFPDYNGFMPGGYGRYVVIECDNGLWTLYGHMIN